MLRHVFTILALTFIVTAAGAQGRDDFFSRLGIKPGAKKSLEEKFFVRLGFNAGAGVLYHNTLFETTNMAALWKTISFSHDPPNSYQWEDFVADYDIQDRYLMPRFGLNLYAATRYFPLFANLEVMSSIATYQKPMIALTLPGFGKDIRPFDRDFFFTVQGGLKWVYDFGFIGREIYTNSIGNEEARDYIETYYDPKDEIKKRSGVLLTTRAGFGHVIGAGERSAIGIEAYYDFDLTDETKRQAGARMRNAGLNIYFRFDLAHTSF
ncbi:MAG: hypothetical protein IT260_09520 [Saprospiraceae bacterium]|nr:hypothetical protein [Saprospiraceae bacterium]